VTTTIFLKATEDAADGSPIWAFRVLHPEALKDPSGQPRLECYLPGNPANPPKVGVEKPITINQLTLRCEYHPPVRFADNDVFEYDVTRCDATSTGQAACVGTTSAPAKVTISVKPRGLRWEIVTNANQSVSSDAPANGNIPTTLGKTSQDVTLTLDWVFRNPQYAPSNDESDVGVSTFDGHFAFKTGLTTKGEGVTATPLAPAASSAAGASTASGAAAPPPTTSQAVAAKRQFSTGAEVNYNWVLPATSSGAFLEIGGLARGSIDVDVEGTTTNQEAAEQVFKLARSGAASFTGEIGGRVTLKQYHDDMFDMRVQRGPDKAVYYPKNSDDFLTAEFGYQRNTALSGLDALGVTPNRYFVRIIATPVEIPNAPGHTKPMIGVELTGGSNQPKGVKILYGVDLSAIGRALGIGQ